MKPFILLIFLLHLSYCGDSHKKIYEMYHKQVSSIGNLDDEMVVKYIQTYRNLRTFGIEFTNYIKQNPKEKQQIFSKIETIIRDGGFTDFSEFVKVNAKIAWAWNMAQARIGLEKQQNLQDWGQKSLAEGEQMIEEQLANPNVPEESKKELRKSLQQLRENKQNLKNTYQKNLKWANWAMEMTMPLTNEQDMEVILRHEKELMEVFTGLNAQQLDQINEHSMKMLGVQ